MCFSERGRPDNLSHVIEVHGCAQSDDAQGQQSESDDLAGPEGETPPPSIGARFGRSVLLHRSLAPDSHGQTSPSARHWNIDADTEFGKRRRWLSLGSKHSDSKSY